MGGMNHRLWATLHADQTVRRANRGRRKAARRRAVSEGQAAPIKGGLDRQLVGKPARATRSNMSECRPAKQSA